MEVLAHAKFVRIAPRKTRLVAGLVRGMPVEVARQQLMFSTKLAARPVLKALESAIANALHNHQIAPEGLVISKAIVNEGPKMKRYTPRAMGRATPIRLRTSHITIGVSPKGEVVAQVKAAKAAKTAKAAKPSTLKVKKAVKTKQATA